MDDPGYVYCRYSTAYAESDYTDKDEGDQGPEQESEEEDKSCVTVLTLRQDDSQEEVDEDEEDEGRLQLLTETPSGELALLLAQSDVLHTGDATLQTKGFRLLLDNKDQVRDDNND